MTLTRVLVAYLIVTVALWAIGLGLDRKKRRLQRQLELRRLFQALQQLDREATRRFRRFKQLMAIHDAQRRNRTTIRELGEDHRRSER